MVPVSDTLTHPDGFLVSTDGVEWAHVDGNIQLPTSILDISFGNGVFVATIYPDTGSQVIYSYGPSGAINSYFHVNCSKSIFDGDIKLNSVTNSSSDTLLTIGADSIVGHKAESSLDVDSARIAGSVDGFSISSSTITSASYFTAPDNDTLKRISISNTLASLGLNDSLITKKVQAGSAINGVTIDSLGIHFRGTAQRWNDIADMNLSGTKGVGSAGEPAWAATGLGFSMNRFAVGDSAQGDGELMHEFAIGDTGDIHLHYHVNGQDASPRHIGVTFDVDIFNAFGDSSVFHYRADIYDTIPANTKHMSQRLLGTGKIAMANTGIGAKCYGTVIRIANGTAPSSNPFFSTIGIHKRIDEMGSTGVYTK